MTARLRLVFGHVRTLLNLTFSTTANYCFLLHWQRLAVMANPMITTRLELVKICHLNLKKHERLAQPRT